jgi:2-hydroxycyclohexanecarboxyl-CoA dehydrogenase
MGSVRSFRKPVWEFGRGVHVERFKDRVVAITGGGAGIGFATACRVAEEGARVALLDWSPGDVVNAAGLLHQRGADYVTVVGDAASRASSQSLIDAALERWGRMDVLVANAGIRHFGSILEATDEDWDQVLAVNLRGVAHSCVAAAKAMRERGEGGAIVLVSSGNALTGRANMPIYDAAKAGLLSLTRSLAIDLAPDRVRVNSVCPGFTVTDFHIRRAEAQGRSADDLRATDCGLLKRPAEPSEMAAAIAFLASDDASYITGTNLMVDAGRHIT